MKIFLDCRAILVTYTKRFENQENLLELNKFLFKMIRRFLPDNLKQPTLWF